jgi:hypothetical protein
MTLRILSLGWGVQSFTVAAMAALDELPRFDFAVHADTTWEHEGTYRFRQKWEPWLGEHGIKVVTTQGRQIDTVDEHWNNSVLIPAFTVSSNGADGQVRRQCTNRWKIAPIRRWIRERIPNPKPGDVECWMGISLDEFQRMRDSDVKYVTNVYPLVDRRMTRADCILWLQNHGLEVPGKSSCVFCPYKSLGAWRALKRNGGGDWEVAVGVDQNIRGRRPQHGPLFVHPHRRPLPEAVTIPEDEGASQLALEFEVPCDGGHCFV